MYLDGVCTLAWKVTRNTILHQIICNESEWTKNYCAPTYQEFDFSLSNFLVIWFVWLFIGIAELYWTFGLRVFYEFRVSFMVYNVYSIDRVGLKIQYLEVKRSSSINDVHSFQCRQEIRIGSNSETKHFVKPNVWPTHQIHTS